MNTSFLDIYKVFLDKISDFAILKLEDDEIQDYCRSLLIAALPKVNPLENDLSYSLEENSFTTTLLPVEIEIIAIQMVAEWIEPQLNSTLLTKQFIGTKDENFFAQANHIDKLKVMLEYQEARSRKLRRDYMYRHFDLENI